MFAAPIFPLGKGGCSFLLTAVVTVRPGRTEHHGKDGLTGWGPSSLWVQWAFFPFFFFLSLLSCTQTQVNKTASGKRSFCFQLLITLAGSSEPRAVARLALTFLSWLKHMWFCRTLVAFCTWHTVLFSVMSRHLLEIRASSSFSFSLFNYGLFLAFFCQLGSLNCIEYL